MNQQKFNFEDVMKKGISECFSKVIKEVKNPDNYEFNI